MLRAGNVTTLKSGRLNFLEASGHVQDCYKDYLTFTFGENFGPRLQVYFLHTNRHYVLIICKVTEL